MLPADAAIPDDVVWIDLLSPALAAERSVEHFLDIDVPTHRSEMEGDRAFEPALCGKRRDLYERPHHQPFGCRGPALAAVSFILSRSRLVTVRYDEPRSFELFNAACRSRCLRCQRRAGLRRADGNDHRTAPAEILTSVGNRIDKVNTEVFDARGASVPGGGTRDYRATLHLLAQESDLIAKVRESMVSIDACCCSFRRGLETVQSLGALRSELKTTLRDVQSLEDHASFLNDKIQFLLDAVLGLVSLDQTNIVKIFLGRGGRLHAADADASIYGMNFDLMPENEMELRLPVRDHC